MNGSAPNSPLIGSQVLRVRNGSPNLRIESIEFSPILTNIAPTTATSSRAQAKSAVRNTASPKFPVGESACRQSHVRRRAPYSEAGLGCVLKFKVQSSRFKVEGQSS